MVLFCDTFFAPDTNEEIAGSVYTDGSLVLEDGTFVQLSEDETKDIYIAYLEKRITEILDIIPNEKDDASFLSPHERINLMWLMIERSSVGKNGLKEYI